MKRRVGLVLLAAMAVGGCQGVPQNQGGGAPSSTGDHAMRDLNPVGNPSAAQMEEAASKQSTMITRAAPDFSLPDGTHRQVKLSDYRGKWVILYFYPKDDTPGCTCQATDFTDLLQRMHDMGAEVIGVSPDTPEMHDYFKEKYHLNLVMLSDPSHRVLEQYGAWAATPMAGADTGRVVRETYLIDPTGHVAWHWPEVIPNGHADRVRAKLAQLQAAGGGGR